MVTFRSRQIVFNSILKFNYFFFYKKMTSSIINLPKEIILKIWEENNFTIRDIFAVVHAFPELSDSARIVLK